MQKRTQGWIAVVMGSFIVVVRLLGIGPKLGTPGAYGAFRTGGFVVGVLILAVGIHYLLRES